MNLLLHLLFVLVMAAHLVAVGICAAGPFVALGLDFHEKSGGETNGAIGRMLLRVVLWMLLIGGLLGAAALAIDWRLDPPGFFSAVNSLPRQRYYFAVGEFLFSAICFWVWLVLWQSDGGMSSRKSTWLRRLLGFVGATNLAYHFPALFSVIAVLSEQNAVTDSSKFLALLLLPETLTRIAHFTLTAITATGLILMLQSMNSKSGLDDISRRQAHRLGARLALVAVLAQWLVGVLMLVTLNPATRSLMLGENALATLLLGGSVVAAAILTHLLGLINVGDSNPRLPRLAAVIFLAILCMMVGVRQCARYHQDPRMPVQAPIAPTESHA